MAFAFSNMRYMNPYQIHKALINEYVLRRPGDTAKLKRDTSNDRTDFDVLKDNHKFLWGEEGPQTWEQKFAKKYYDKLFKEYAIGDLSRYKENKIALRWRTEQEVVSGRGQFTCANKRCDKKENLKTWEVNFGYIEDNVKKNALVKIRLCLDCSDKLNYVSKKREVKRLKYKKKANKKRKSSDKNKDGNNEDKEASSSNLEESTETVEEEENEESGENKEINESPWANLKPPDMKSRDEEIDEYLDALLF